MDQRRREEGGEKENSEMDQRRREEGGERENSEGGKREEREKTVIWIRE